VYSRGIWLSQLHCMAIVRGVPQVKYLMSFKDIYEKFWRQFTIQKGKECAAGEHFDDFLAKREFGQF